MINYWENEVFGFQVAKSVPEANKGLRVGVCDYCSFLFER
jgi:hypothetical protein